MERDDVARAVVGVTQSLADGHRNGITQFSTNETRETAEACAIAVSNAGVFILQQLGFSTDEIKERVVAFRNSQLDD